MGNLFSDDEIYNNYIRVSKDYSSENTQGELLIIKRDPAVFTGWADNYEEVFHKQTELIYQAYQKSLTNPDINIYEEARHVEYKIGLLNFTLG